MNHPPPIGSIQQEDFYIQPCPLIEKYKAIHSTTTSNALLLKKSQCSIYPCALP